MKNLLLIAFASLFILSGCSITGNYEHVEAITMDAAAAPEVRGASGYQKPNTRSSRFSANVYSGISDKESIQGIRNKLGDCSKISGCEGFNEAKINVKEDVDATYKTTIPYFSASAEMLKKNDLTLWSLGLSINDGLYGFGSFGFNTTYFEIGATLGFWFNYRDFNYSGTSYYCSESIFDSEDIHRTNIGGSSNSSFVFTYGGYVSAYYEQFSLNYSLNVYRPRPNYANSFSSNENTELQADFDLPIVLTEYITAGYRIGQNWEIRLGAVNTFGEFPGWHWNLTAGLSYYPN